MATVPRTPSADSDPEFRGKAFMELLEQYGVQHNQSIPYSPHTNVAVKRLNQTIRSQLAAACHGDQRDLDKKLLGVMAQFNQIPHSETSRQPAEFFINEMVHPNLPIKTKPWRLPARNFKSFVAGDLVLRMIISRLQGRKVSCLQGLRDLIKFFQQTQIL